MWVGGWGGGRIHLMGIRTFFRARYWGGGSEINNPWRRRGRILFFAYVGSEFSFHKNVSASRSPITYTFSAFILLRLKHS